VSKYESVPIEVMNDPFFEEKGRKSLKDAWAYLSKSKAFKDGYISYFRGVRYELNKGELVTSLQELANEWQWTKTEVNTYLKYCEKIGLISKDAGKNSTIIKFLSRKNNNSKRKQTINTRKTPKFNYSEGLQGVEKHQKNTEKTPFSLLSIKKDITKVISKKDFFAHPQFSATAQLSLEEVLFAVTVLLKEDCGKYILNETFRKLVRSFLEIRYDPEGKKKVTPMSFNAIERFVSKIQKTENLEVAIEMLSRAIDKRWESIYPLKNEDKARFLNTEPKQKQAVKHWNEK